VARATTNTTNDVSCEVALLWTVIFAMPKAPTVLANLVLVVTESTVQCCEFAKLIAFVVILAFGRRCSLEERQEAVNTRTNANSPFQ